MTLNQKLGSMIAVLWLGLVAIGFIGAWQSRSSTMDDRREQLKALVARRYHRHGSFPESRREQDDLRRRSEKARA